MYLPLLPHCAYSPLTQTIASFGFLALQGESAFILAKMELKPSAIAMFPFCAVVLVGACDAGFGALIEGLATAGEGWTDCWVLLGLSAAVLAEFVDTGVAVPVNTFDKEIVGRPGSVDPVLATAAGFDAKGDFPEEDVAAPTEEAVDSWVAAPGPLPKAGTEPTCFDSVGEGAAAECSYCDGEAGEAVGAPPGALDVVSVLSEVVVAAPGPSPKAGTDPICLEADGVGDPSLCCAAGEVEGGAVGAAGEVELRKRGCRRPSYRIRPAATVLDSTASSTSGCRRIFSRIQENSRSWERLDRD